MKTVLTGSNYNLERFNSVSNGTKVELVHDKENEHSQYAVSVIAKGIGLIGHMYEAYVPAGVRQYEEELINSKTFIKEVLDKNLSFRAQIIQKKPNTAIIGIVVDADNSNDEMEKDNMIKWTENVSGEVVTLVGCSHNQTAKNIGDEIVLDVSRFSVTPDGRIKGTATAYTKDGQIMGVLPNSQAKITELEKMGVKFISGDKFKEQYASNVAKTEGYVVIDVSECGRYVKLGNQEDKEELSMERTITYGFSKMNELITLYDVENIVEEVIDLINDPNSAYNRMRAIMPNRDWAEDKDGRFLITKPSKEVVEPETISEDVKSVTAGEDMLKSRIDEIKASIDAKKAELNQLEADLEMFEKELANVEHRNALISEIKDNIFGLATEDIIKIHQIVMNDVASSSTPEEDIPSSIEEENFVIDFKDHYEERISRFEQSDIQKENNICDIVLYYASNTWGSERTIKDVKLSDNVVEYLKSVIPHNQCMGEHVIELEMALETML